ncbi:bromodomain-containing protein 4-like [Schistocerca serialis cubense]|uniref:bromodomain-containing protein 4-like n=1 Tax=Schistocerca serialis cubense TaxID=2023355 RepID=UPI00214E3788|nr:bromodomain-containing protein 4-like [Schistocerca serialis cubense]
MDDAVANAVGALKSAMAEERAVLRAEVDEVRLQLVQLRELLVCKSRKGRDVRTATITTQMVALSAPAVTQGAMWVPTQVVKEMPARSSKGKGLRKQDSEPARPATRDDVAKGVETPARPPEDKAEQPLVEDEDACCRECGRLALATVPVAEQPVANPATPPHSEPAAPSCQAVAGLVLARARRVKDRPPPPPPPPTYAGDAPPSLGN